MKTITFKSIQLAVGASTTVASVSGDVVMVGSVEETTPTMPSQQTTVSYYNDANPTWTRAIQASNLAITVVRNGSTPVAWTTDLIVRGALLLETSLSWDTFVLRNPDDVTTGFTSLLTCNGTLPTATNTVVINGITYTFVSAIGSTARNVLIDASASSNGGKVANTLANLAACINNSAGAGTLYVATTPTPAPDASVTATLPSDTTLRVTAKAGVANVATTTTGTVCTWATATLLCPPVSFFCTVSTEMTPVAFVWQESATGDFTGEETTVSAGGIYAITQDGTGLTSVLSISRTTLATGYHYRCVASDSSASVLTSDGTLPADGDVVGIGATTYTLRSSIGSAGDVLIGATVAETLENLAACIDGEAGATTLYTPTTVTPNASVRVKVLAATYVSVEAKFGVTGVILTTSSAGTATLDWSTATIPETVISSAAVLTIT